MKANTRLYSVLNCTVHVSVCGILVCRSFGLSTFWSFDVLVCRRFSLSTFRSVDVSVCRRFGLPTFWLSTFRFVDVLTSYLQKDPL